MKKYRIFEAMARASMGSGRIMNNTWDAYLPAMKAPIFMLQANYKANRDFDEAWNAKEWAVEDDTEMIVELSPVAEAELYEICKRLGELAFMLDGKLTENEWLNGFKDVDPCSN